MKENKKIKKAKRKRRKGRRIKRKTMVMEKIRKPRTTLEAEIRMPKIMMMVCSKVIY